MNYRRYYPRGSKKAYVLSDEQFDKMVKDLGFEAAVEKDNAQIELVPESVDEALTFFHESCENVIRNTRFYLENLDKIPTFKLRYTDLYMELDKNSAKTENFIN